MNQLAAMLVGFVAAALLFSIGLYLYRVARRAQRVLVGIVVSIQQVSPALKRISILLEQVSKELAFLRQIMSPQQQVDMEGMEVPEPMKKTRVDFPSDVPIELFRDIQADAKPEDNNIEVIQQDDDEFVDIEKSEILREMGIEVEDDSVKHEGIEVEAK